MMALAVYCRHQEDTDPINWISVADSESLSTEGMFIYAGCKAGDPDGYIGVQINPCNDGDSDLRFDTKRILTGRRAVSAP